MAQVNLDWALGLGFSSFIFLAVFKFSRSLALVWLWRSLITLGVVSYFEGLQGFDGLGHFAHSIAGEYRGIFPSLIVVEHNFLWLSDVLVRVLGFSHSYQALKVLFSLIGFIGVLLFAKVVAEKTKYSFLHIVWVLHLIPSVAYWTAIFGKDPMVFFGVQLSFYSFVKKDKYLGVFGWLLTALIRPWVAIFLALSYLATRKDYFRSLGYVSIFTATFGLLWWRFRVDSVGGLVSLIDNISHAWNHGSTAGLVPTFQTVGDVLIYWPKGMFAALFAPMPWDHLPGLSVVFGVESLVYLILFLSFLVALKKRGISFLYTGLMERFVALYLCFWAIFYAFISPQNMIAGARFKISVLFALFYLLLAAKSHEEPTRS